jgi:hypothetical protein
VAKGGSFYIQSKVFYAKEELLKEFPDAEKAYYEKMGLNPDGTKKEEPAEAGPKAAAGDKKPPENEENEKEEKKEDKK